MAETHKLRAAQITERVQFPFTGTNHGACGYHVTGIPGKYQSFICVTPNKNGVALRSSTDINHLYLRVRGPKKGSMVLGTRVKGMENAWIRVKVRKQGYRGKIYIPIQIQGERVMKECNGDGTDICPNIPHPASPPTSIGGRLARDMNMFVSVLSFVPESTFRSTLVCTHWRDSLDMMSLRTICIATWNNLNRCRTHWMQQLRTNSHDGVEQRHNGTDLNAQLSLLLNKQKQTQHMMMAVNPFFCLVRMLVEQCGVKLVKWFCAYLVYGLLTEPEMTVQLQKMCPNAFNGDGDGGGSNASVGNGMRQVRLLIEALAKKECILGQEDVLMLIHPIQHGYLNHWFHFTTCPNPDQFKCPHLTLNVKKEIEHFGFPFRRFMIGRRISLYLKTTSDQDQENTVRSQIHTCNIVRSQSNHVYWLAGDTTVVFVNNPGDKMNRMPQPKSQKQLMELMFFQHKWHFIDTTTSIDESNRVCLTDLKTKKHNGKVGIRGSFATFTRQKTIVPNEEIQYRSVNKNDPERYMITLDDGEVLNIKPSNLKEAPLSPQVWVHKELQNHARVGKLHRFFATKVCKEEQQLQSKEDIVSILEGVQTYGRLKWEKNTGGVDIFEERRNDLLGNNGKKNCGALSPAFAGLLIGLSFGQTKAYTPILAQMENLPQMDNANLEKSLAFVYGRLEVAKFLISSFANFTEEHGVQIRLGNVRAVPETSLHSLIKDLLILQEWGCATVHTENVGVCIANEEQPWTFVAPENPDAMLAIIARLLSIPFEKTTHGTRKQRQEVVNSCHTSCYCETGYEELEDPYDTADRFAETGAGNDWLAAHAQSNLLQASLNWNTGNHLKGCRYAVQAIHMYECVYGILHADGRHAGGTLSRQTVECLFSLADSWNILGICLQSGLHERGLDFLIACNINVVLERGLKYLDVLRSSITFSQKQKLQQRIDQMEGRIRHDMGLYYTTIGQPATDMDTDAKVANRKKALALYQSALAIRESCYDSQSIAVGLSCVNVGNGIIQLVRRDGGMNGIMYQELTKLVFEAMPYLHQALSIFAIEIGSHGSGYVYHAQKCYQRCLHNALGVLRLKPTNQHHIRVMAVCKPQAQSLTLLRVGLHFYRTFTCAYCKKIACRGGQSQMKRCSGCLVIFYCGQECKWGWGEGEGRGGFVLFVLICWTILELIFFYNF